jgi:hypothetical protein
MAFCLINPKGLELGADGVMEDSGGTFAIRLLAKQKPGNMLLGYINSGQAALEAWKADTDFTYADDDADLLAMFTDKVWGQDWLPQVSITSADLTSPVTLHNSFLESLKTEIYADIDKHTRELIAQGFEYPAASGQMFSLSTEAQHTWTNMYVARTLLSYPISVTTFDEQDDESLADADDVVTFYTAMVTAARGHLDSGRALKNTLRDDASTDEASILAAVTDDR